MFFVFIEILFKICVLIYAEHCICKRWKRKEWKRKSKEVETENTQLQCMHLKLKHSVMIQDKVKMKRSKQPQNNKNEKAYSITDEGENMMILQREENLPVTVRWTVKWQSRNTEKSRCVEDKQMRHSWFWWRNECMRKRGKSDVRWDLSVHALRP